MSRDVPPPLRALVRDTYRALMQRCGGRPRQCQRIMIGEIARCSANARKANEPARGERFLAVQAATGTGKSFAYGCGAIPIGLTNGLKIVIATATVQLQEQLHSRDLAELQAVIPEMRPVLIKGRGRYACPVRMAQLAEHEPDSDASVRGQELLSHLVAGRWTGDIDELQAPPPPATWSRFTNDRNGCLARRCSSFASCPYYRARAAAESANVFVTNHDLLLADLQAGSILLPKPEDTILVIDEAHHFPQKALEALAGEHALADARNWVMRAGGLVAAMRRAARNGALGILASELIAALEAMGGSLAEAQMAIERQGQTTEVRDERRPVCFRGGRLPTWLAQAALECRATAEAAREKVQSICELLQTDDSGGLSERQREYFACEAGIARGRIDRIVAVWRLMTRTAMDEAPVAKWVELTGGDDEQERDIRVCACPTSVGEILDQTLWARVAASIHLSATLTTVGGFEPHLHDSGLDRTPGVQTLEVASPFDYPAQARLVVPRNIRSPKDVPGHTEDLISLIVDATGRMAPATGALCLFASWQQLRTVAAAMPPEVCEHLLIQGTVSRRDLLQHHARRIELGLRSIIFATAGLEEGVDLRGNLCTLVVVAKLQFPVPTDPVSQTREEFFQETHRDYFTEVILAQACRRLAQSAGRLIRSETDTGEIIVADPRLTGTRYGRSMLATLPPFTLQRPMLQR